MARFFSSTLMGLTATAGAIGAPGLAPPINTLFVDVVIMDVWLAEFSKPSFERYRALRESGAAKASVVTS